MFKKKQVIDKMADVIPNDEIVEKEEWIWVDGFKGMDENMKCLDFQYEIGGEYIHEGEIEECKAGFHLCKYLEETTRYYDFDFKNRYFKVKALVRKKDFAECREYQPINFNMYESFYNPYRSKLAAKEIKIISEITDVEYLKVASYFAGCSVENMNEYKKIGEIGCEMFVQIKRREVLLGLGKYSSTFVDWLLTIVKIDEKTYKKAIALAAEDISHDMRIALLLQKD